MKGWQVAGCLHRQRPLRQQRQGRPEWERLLADIEAGKIDAVAAWDQDRVNRMMEDFVHYKKLFVARGIQLATSNNGDIDLTTPRGVLTATIKTAVSEHEIAMMRIRMKRAARHEGRAGCAEVEAGVRLSRRHPPARPAHRAAGQAGVRRRSGRGSHHRHRPRLERRRRLRADRQAVDRRRP